MIETAAIVHSPMIAIVVQMTRWPDLPISLQNFTAIDRLFTHSFRKRCSYLHRRSDCLRIL